ncbi:response regulator [Paenibacillus etheri]|uniref:Two-component system response regulator n=1 Tax=Paenibacillus etheri TaxID=1306852 RepID=A0A0W1AV99_9BACL|nr:response regulator [Paenibacillus etheri]KTD85260.1 hypothetical protein UQ64_21725 [Paenibacillus etheri]
MLKVLIVDDEEIIREGLKRIVDWTSLGYTVAGEASSGLEALNLLQHEYFHVMVTDITMPRMDGLELIRRIRQKQISIKIIILSGYNDFRFVKEAMKFSVEDYLLKPVEETELTYNLHSLKETINSELETNHLEKENMYILTNKLMNRIATRTLSLIDFKNRADFLELKLPEAPFYVGAIELDSMNNYYSETLDADVRLNVYACKNIVEELLRNYGLTCILFEDENHRIIYLCGETNFSPHPRELAENIRCSIVQYAKEPVTISISAAVHSFSALHEAYFEAVRLLEYTFFMGKSTVITKELLPSLDQAPNQIKYDRSAYAKAIRNGNSTELTILVRKIFGEVALTCHHSKVYVQTISLELLIQAFDIVKEANGDLSALFDGTESMYRQLLSIKSMEGTFEHLIEILNAVISYLTRLRSSRPNKIIEHILAYIEQYYSHDLKLIELGELFYINPSYLGKLFKKETNISFKDFLNQVRVTKAMEMLIESTEKVYLISEAVGYRDYNYFCRIFKKHFGVIPSDVRN